MPPKTPRRAPLILVVDDLPGVRTMYAASLRRRGFDVIDTESGIEANALAEKRHPDAVLLDVFLRDRDGVHVCRLIKENPRTSRIPVVLFTSFPTSPGMKDLLARSFRGVRLLHKSEADPGTMALALRAAIRSARDGAVAVPDEVLRLGAFHADPLSRRVWFAGEPPVRIPPQRFRLLMVLMENPGGLTPAELLAKAWGGAGDIGEVYVAVNRLKHDLARVGAVCLRSDRRLCWLEIGNTV